MEIEIESGALDVFAEIAVGIGFIDGGAEGAGGIDKFASDIDIAGIGLGGESGDGHPFNENEGGLLHDLFIFEGAGFAFVGVAEDEVVGSGFFFFDAVPFDPGGESGTASTAEAGGFDFIDDGLAFHFEGFLEPFVSAFIEVALEGSESVVVRVFE